MNIKSYLKSVHLTQLELSEKLALSRPTLDAYIQQFELSERIPREKYQLSFEKLFGIPLKDESEFKKALEQIEMFIKSDTPIPQDDLQSREATVLSLVTSSIKKDLCKPDVNLDIYVFINLIIQNYRRNESIRYIIDYFLALYARKDTSTMCEDDRIMLSNLHRVLSVDKHNHFEKGSFDDLVETSRLYNDKKTVIRKRIQNQLLDELSSKIQILTEAGVEINSDEFELLYKT